LQSYIEGSICIIDAQVQYATLALLVAAEGEQTGRCIYVSGMACGYIEEDINSSLLLSLSLCFNGFPLGRGLGLSVKVLNCMESNEMDVLEVEILLPDCLIAISRYFA